jgi:hypothetical protein
VQVPYGTMAERTVAPRAFCLPVPEGVDDLTAAALPNPALSSWLALEWRARLEILGSGGGSIPHAAIFETFPKLWELAAGGGLRVDADPVPLAEVQEAWRRPGASGRRLVFVL